MQLAPCRFREVQSPRDELRCQLVQHVLGLANSEGCRVEAQVCRECIRFGAPSPGCLNAVVSSLVYTVARDIRQNGGRSDCDVGRAWQGECFARATLATDSEQSRAPSRTERGSISRVGRAFARRRPSTTIGLVGYGDVTGLGYLNRDLAERGAVDKWLLVDHPHFAAIDLPAMSAGITRVSDDMSESFARRWLRGVDWVVWAETCPLPTLVELARQESSRVACIPMWEWTSPTDAWLRCVDLLICPTRHAYQLFTDWKHRFGFSWRVAYFPWPISAERFRFRCRRRCQRFVVVNGHGGAWARSIARGSRLGPRKGLDVALAAAELTPEIEWRVYTQLALDVVPPANVDIHVGPADHTSLYAEGDVCVQPSRWEGLGLPLLECQAAGMPLVTVDAPPMNEYRALRTVSASRWDWGYVTEGQPIRIPEISPEQLARVVRELHGCDLRASSAEANIWIERERSWSTALKQWRKLFE